MVLGIAWPLCLRPALESDGRDPAGDPVGAGRLSPPAVRRRRRPPALGIIDGGRDGKASVLGAQPGRRRPRAGGPGARHTQPPDAGMSLIDRVAISVYALSFYLWKTVVPAALSAAYELPPPSGFETWPAALSGAVVLLATVVVIAGHRRWPALGAVWVGYIVILSPVVWIPWIAADRYTYLAGAGLALLGGAGLSLGWRAWETRKIDMRIAVPLAGLAVSVVAALGILTWNQVKVWRDSETLWTHAVAARPSALGHFKLGVTLAHRGDLTKAIENFHAALRINPSYASAHSALGFAFALQGRLTEATEQFDHALRIRPRQADAHTGLGLLLARQSRLSTSGVWFSPSRASSGRRRRIYGRPCESILETPGPTAAWERSSCVRGRRSKPKNTFRRPAGCDLEPPRPT